jgi:hypothetical protein
MIVVSALVEAHRPPRPQIIEGTKMPTNKAVTTHIPTSYLKQSSFFFAMTIVMENPRIRSKNPLVGNISNLLILIFILIFDIIFLE